MGRGPASRCVGLGNRPAIVRCGPASSHFASVRLRSTGRTARAARRSASRVPSAGRCFGGWKGRALSCTGRAPGPLRSAAAAELTGFARIAREVSSYGAHRPATPSCSTLGVFGDRGGYRLFDRGRLTRQVGSRLRGATGNSPRGVPPPTSTGRPVGCGAPSWCSARRTQAVIRQHRGQAPPIRSTFFPTFAPGSGKWGSMLGPTFSTRHSR